MIDKEEVTVGRKKNVCRPESTHKPHLLCLLSYPMGGGGKRKLNCISYLLWALSGSFDVHPYK